MSATPEALVAARKWLLASRESIDDATERADLDLTIEQITSAIVSDDIGNLRTELQNTRQIICGLGIALHDCIASLEGYRTNCVCEGGGELPCDAERGARDLLSHYAILPKAGA